MGWNASGGWDICKSWSSEAFSHYGDDDEYKNWGMSYLFLNNLYAWKKRDTPKALNSKLKAWVKNQLAFRQLQKNTLI